MKLPLRTREVASALALILAGIVATPDATAQNRDLNTERLLLDDAAGDGTRNTLLLQVPPGGLTANRVLTFPDAGGTVMTGAAPLAVNQILFGGPTGQSAQSANLLWDNGAGIFNIGAGNFTVDAATGNTSVAGTLAVTGATSLSSLALTGKATSASTVGGDPGTTLVTKDYLIAGNLAVLTDATLTGDGAAGSPLGIDLTNANTWTGTQTFGQVAALSIATFDADVTLGDSPTDAITVNGTLAGATPLSFEGASSDVNETSFAITDPTADRTITFPDASGTVAFLSDIAVTTNATLLGDGTGGDPLRINLTNANTWTGTQTFGQVAALSIATFDADVTLGDSPTDAITVNGTLAGATPLSFEGASSDVNETSFAITDPTADRTITFPDASGTVAFLSDIAVTTNATLLGDGTGGDPLRINLTNANTWTGEQTLPATAAQGDALIASTNAGTTTIDAARIGTGLTDAQVNDNLTISGGTVDATPIGATTPSTGAFTNATVGGELQLVETGGGTDYVGFQAPAVVAANQIWTLPAADGTSGQVLSTDGAGVLSWITNSATVSTDATLTGDGSGGSPLGIDLTSANTWTGTQTLATTAAQGDALIASTNAGTTTIDAARIGTGLTDAQVDDNLTISGGTVDGTPVGATTQSTGEFTTLDASGAITGGSSLTLGVDGLTPTAGSLVLHDNSAVGVTGTLVVGGLTSSRTYTLPNADGTVALTTDLTVSTDVTLTGDGEGTPLGIDLTNANSWTGAQTFSSVDIDGGTIDGTVIGGASQAAGSFTTVTASGNLTVNTGGTSVVVSSGSIDMTSVTDQTLALANSDGTGVLNVTVEGDLSAGGDLATGGDVLINGATQTTNSRLTVNEGHWTTQGTVTTVTLSGDLGSPTVAANSTDVAGQVGATGDGTSGASTATITVNFQSGNYAGTPFVTITPATAAAASSDYYVSAVAAGSFTISFAKAASSSATYDFYYQVIEGN